MLGSRVVCMQGISGVKKAPTPLRSRFSNLVTQKHRSVPFPFRTATVRESVLLLVAERFQRIDAAGA